MYINLLLNEKETELKINTEKDLDFPDLMTKIIGLSKYLSKI